jgi:hypothetical protein
MANELLSKDIAADEENFPQGFEGNEEISFVHFSKKEAKVWDTVQGGPYIEQEEGYLPLRSYRPLGDLIKKPEFLELLLHIRDVSGKDGIPDQPELHQAYEQGQQLTENKSMPWEDAPGDDIPEIAKLAREGKDNDSIVVYMPMNVIFMMGALGDGKIKVNPTTGYPAFGFFKEIGKVFRSNPVREVLRIGTTVAGAVLGGPLGAAAGSAAGSALTGRRPQDWLGQAAKAGALTCGAQLAAPYIPGFGAVGAGLAGSGIPGMAALGGTMGGWAAPAAAAAAPAVAGATGNMLQQGAAAGAAGAAGAAAPAAAAPTGIAGLMSNPLVQAAPFALAMGSGFMAKNADKERYQLEQKERAQLMREQKEREEEMLRKSGFYTPLQKQEHNEVVLNPSFGEPGEPYYIHKGDSRFDSLKNSRGYAKGGEIVSKSRIPLRKKSLIEGPGKGQTDAIHTNAEEGSYILPADVVAMAGDGSTDAGTEAINDCLDDAVSKVHPDKVRHVNCKQPLIIPVALSRGEVYVSPFQVIALGSGHHSEGVKKLDALRANIRKHKISNGNDLPPKAKNLKSYMEM